MTETQQKHIFLVEDDQRLAALTIEYLEQNDFHVSHISRGDKAVSAILSSQPDLVILDLMLPGLDGLEVFRQVQPSFHNPVLMLTARDEDIDQVLGLELGADDYVIKPVQPRLLLARIHALLRRTQKLTLEPDLKTQLHFGELVIDTESRLVSLDNELIELTTNEFELLLYLANHAGEIRSRDHILNAVRGINYDGLDRWVDIRVSRLRQKLGDDADQPRRIKTVWGKGYLFVRDAWSS